MDTKKINAFASNFWIKLTANKKLFIVSCIVNLLGIPMFIFAKILQTKAENARILYEYDYMYMDYYDYYLYYMISMAAMCILLVIVLISAFNTFNYLYSKPMVDVIYSLPITIKQRFFSDYLAGFAITGIPYAASLIISLIINGISFGAVPAWASADVQGDIGSTSVILHGYLYVFLVMLMLYTLTVLVLTFCGSIIEGIGYTVIVNAIVPIVVFILFAFTVECVYGLESAETGFEFLQYTTVFGGLAVILNLISGIIDNSSFSKEYIQYALAGADWIIIYLLVTAAILALAYFLYRKRKAEDVTKPFVFKAIYYIIMTCICFCMSAGIVIFSIMDGDEIRISAGIPWIISGAIVFFILDTLQNRGFRKFGAGVIKYIAMTGGSVLLLMTIVWTDGFGSTYNVPDSEDIESISCGYSRSLFSNGYDVTTLNETEKIEEIITLHNAIIDDYKNFISTKPNAAQRISYIPENSTANVDITYNLKSGRSVTREYEIDANKLYNLYKLYLDGDSIDNITDTLKRHYSEEYYRDTDYIQPNISDKFDYHINCSAGRDKMLKLISAYEKDLRNADINEMLNEAETYCFFDGYAVLATYTNTINCLKEEFGIEVTESSLKDTLLNSINENNAVICMDSSIIADYAGTDFLAPFTSYVPFYKPSEKAYGVNISYTNKKDFVEMLVHAEPCYVTNDMDSIMIQYNGNNYILPSEYRSYAEDFISSLSRSEYKIYNQEYFDTEAANDYYYYDNSYMLQEDYRY